MLYAAEITWRGQKGVEKEYQTAINCMGRSTLGTWNSTPRVILTGESGLTPARALLNHHQARFTQRLYAKPRNSDGIGDGPEILVGENSDLTTRLRAAAGLGRRGTVERQQWSINR